MHTGNWYQFGQTAVYRWKDRAKATKYATVIKAFCNNDHIGYDQSQRTSLYEILKANKWDYRKVTKNCECDCSSLVGDGINCTVGKALISSGIWTGNLDSLLMKTGLFEKLTASKYLTSGDYLMTGDIINNPNQHVISALANGSKATSSPAPATKKSIATVAKEVIAGKWGNGDDRVQKLKDAGYNPTEVQKKVNELLKSKEKTPAKTLKVGSKVKIKNGANQFGKTARFASQVYKNTYKVIEIRGSRVVFADAKGVVIGAVKKSDCIVQ